jgi:hypothetical protein
MCPQHATVCRPRGGAARSAAPQRQAPIDFAARLVDVDHGRDARPRQLALSDEHPCTTPPRRGLARAGYFC